MPRLTISLPDDLLRALELRAARRGITIDELVAESLEFSGIGSAATAGNLVARARPQSDLGADDAFKLAIDETRITRDP